VKEDEIFTQLSDSLARIFTELRKSKGYTSSETFAFDHEFPRVQYWRVETGRTNITIKTLARLLLIHNLTLEEFLTLLVKEVKGKKH
jgi:transcriptional regulator with XRE-family HTH domain